MVSACPRDSGPLPATGPVGLSGCGCLPARGATPQQRELTDDERQGLVGAVRACCGGVLRDGSHG